MDVKRKLMLLNTYESYWLMLPSEIQEYILVFKTSQDVIQHAKEYQKAQMSRNRTVLQTESCMGTGSHLL